MWDRQSADKPSKDCVCWIVIFSCVVFVFLFGWLMIEIWFFKQKNSNRCHDLRNFIWNNLFWYLWQGFLICFFVFQKKTIIVRPMNSIMLFIYNCVCDFFLICFNYFSFGSKHVFHGKMRMFYFVIFKIMNRCRLLQTFCMFIFWVQSNFCNLNVLVIDWIMNINGYLLMILRTENLWKIIVPKWNGHCDCVFYQRVHERWVDDALFLYPSWGH